MSRNASGTYSLVAGNPVVTGTTITSTWANNTLTDIANALTDSLDRTGKGAMSAALKGVLGAVGTPGFTFDGDTNTGMWSPGADILAFAAGGAEPLRITVSSGVCTANFNTSRVTAGTILTTAGTTGTAPDGAYGQFNYSVASSTTFLMSWELSGGVLSAYKALESRALTHKFQAVSSGTTLYDAFGGDANGAWLGFFTSTINPTTSEIPANYARVWHNSTSGETRLWANVSGVLKSVLLS